MRAQPLDRACEMAARCHDVRHGPTARRSGRGRRSPCRTGRHGAITAVAVLVGALWLLAGCGAAEPDPGAGSTAPPSPVSSAPVTPVITCTAVGCSSVVVVDLLDLPGDFDQRATVCIDLVCTHPEFVDGASIGERLPGEPFPDSWTSGGAPFVMVPAPDSHITTVRVTVLDSAGETMIDDAITAPLTEHQPNGPGCPPTCWYVRVAFDPTTGQLTAVDANGHTVKAR